MKQARVKIKPSDTLTFPNICVHCGQPGTHTLRLRKRMGRVTRLIDVPLCADCHRDVSRRSGEEERRQKLGWLLSGVAALLALALGLLLTPASLNFWARLLLALLIGVGVGTAVTVAYQPWIRRAALPAKQAVLAAAKIETFTWRTTTFAFENEQFATRFRRLNEARLMES